MTSKQTQAKQMRANANDNQQSCDQQQKPNVDGPPTQSSREAESERSGGQEERGGRKETGKETRLGEKKEQQASRTEKMACKHTPSNGRMKRNGVDDNRSRAIYRQAGIAIATDTTNQIQQTERQQQIMHIHTYTRTNK